MNLDLFGLNARENICDGAILLREFALDCSNELLSEMNALVAQAPFRKMFTPSGLPMSVTTTSCGSAGWVSDSYGYRYAKQDLQSKQTWPAIPTHFLALAKSAALSAGYEHFNPDSCLINSYEVGAKLSLHQDKNERDFTQPIVSVSLGLPAIFLFGGLLRTDKTIRVPLVHGDVVVWGGAARLFFHGVLPIKPGTHSVLGERRINLTFRKAL